MTYHEDIQIETDNAEADGELADDEYAQSLENDSIEPYDWFSPVEQGMYDDDYSEM